MHLCWAGITHFEVNSVITTSDDALMLSGNYNTRVAYVLYVRQMKHQTMYLVHVHAYRSSETRSHKFWIEISLMEKFMGGALVHLEYACVMCVISGDIYTGRHEFRKQSLWSSIGTFRRFIIWKKTFVSTYIDCSRPILKRSATCDVRTSNRRVMLKSRDHASRNVVHRTDPAWALWAPWAFSLGHQDQHGSHSCRTDKVCQTQNEKWTS